MSIPDISLYIPLCLVLKSILGHFHLGSLTSVCDLVWALLSAQSLRHSDLARSLANTHTLKARQAYKRVRRILGRPYLTSAFLTPLLIRVTLALLPQGPLILILDSTRLCHWELFTLGVCFSHRVLPLAWAIIPYPWPVHSFTPTVDSLLRRTLDSWPPDRALHLLADRGFPSYRLFHTLQHYQLSLPLAFSLRVRAGDWVVLGDGKKVKVGELMRTVRLGKWQVKRVRYSRSKLVTQPLFLTLGQAQAVYPAHQRGEADSTRRRLKEERRRKHLLSKKQPASEDTDKVWAILSTEKEAKSAVTYYASRFTTEGTYRDLKSWGLEVAGQRESEEAELNGLVGLASIAYLLQVAIGTAAGRAEGEARARTKLWSTTGRLSSFWCGRQVLTDHSYSWHYFLEPLLLDLAQALKPGSAEPQFTKLRHRKRPPNANTIPKPAHS